MTSRPRGARTMPPNDGPETGHLSIFLLQFYHNQELERALPPCFGNLEYVVALQTVVRRTSMPIDHPRRAPSLQPTPATGPPPEGIPCSLRRAQNALSLGPPGSSALIWPSA